jgi:hypothetical protein
MTATVFTRALIALPSPLAGEGGPQGRMRGRFGVDRQGRCNPSSDLAALGHLLPQGEKGPER